MRRTRCMLDVAGQGTWRVGAAAEAGVVMVSGARRTRTAAGGHLHLRVLAALPIVPVRVAPALPRLLRLSLRPTVPTPIGSLARRPTARQRLPQPLGIRQQSMSAVGQAAE